MRALKSALAPACSKGQRYGILFLNEFRLLSITLLTIVAALSFQNTLQEFFQVYVRARLASGRRILYMLLFSLGLFALIIVIVLVWKPFAIPV